MNLFVPIRFSAISCTPTTLVAEGVGFITIQMHLFRWKSL